MDDSRGGSYVAVSPMAALWWAEMVAAREHGWTRPGQATSGTLTALAPSFIEREPPAEVQRARTGER